MVITVYCSKNPRREFGKGSCYSLWRESDGSSSPEIP